MITVYFSAPYTLQELIACTRMHACVRVGIVLLQRPLLVPPFSENQLSNYVYVGVLSPKIKVETI